MFKEKVKIMRSTPARHYGARKSKCKKCHKPFTFDPKIGWKGTEIIVKIIKWTPFRGDDIVEFYHPDCFDGEVPE